MRIWIVLVVWGLISCKEIKNCQLVEDTNYAIVRFYRADTLPKTVKEVAFLEILENDSTFYIHSMRDTLDDDTLTATAVFINPADTLVRYRFLTDSMDFLLQLTYDRHLRIYDDDCDPVYSFRLKSASSDEFDSVAILNPTLNKNISNNVEIFL